MCTAPCPIGTIRVANIIVPSISNPWRYRNSELGCDETDEAIQLLMRTPAYLERRTREVCEVFSRPPLEGRFGLAGPERDER